MKTLFASFTRPVPKNGVYAIGNGSVTVGRFTTEISIKRFRAAELGDGSFVVRDLGTDPSKQGQSVIKIYGHFGTIEERMTLASKIVDIIQEDIEGTF